jgi:hypothetical protein
MARPEHQANSRHWHSTGQRLSPYHLAGNRNAARPVNAISTAYAALESEIRIKAISRGYDSTVGIMDETQSARGPGVDAALSAN